MSFTKLDILNYLLSFFNIKSFRQIEKKKINIILLLLKPIDADIKLIRIGSDYDGGYLVPNILHKIKYCFSPGVGKTSSFEKGLEKYNIKSFLADNSVNKPFENLKNFDFDKKNIHAYNKKNKINVNNWIYSKIKKQDLKKSILQIDVDGFEYEILLAIDDLILSNIQILIVEFHNLELIGNEYYYYIVHSVLEKIRLYHTPIHLHPNNCNGLHKINRYKIPSVLEVTFLNNKLIRNKKKIKSLPHYLDNRNVRKKKDIYLETYWYR